MYHFFGAICSESAIRVSDGILFAADSLNRRILAINLTSADVAVIYETIDDLQLHSIAASEHDVYFAAWNRKYDLFHGRTVTKLVSSISKSDECVFLPTSETVWLFQKFNTVVLTYRYL